MSAKIKPETMLNRNHTVLYIKSMEKRLIIKNEKCMICIFFTNKKKFEVKNFNPFFCCKFAFVLKYNFYEKKKLHAKIDNFVLITESRISFSPKKPKNYIKIRINL